MKCGFPVLLLVVAIIFSVVADDEKCPCQPKPRTDDVAGQLVAVVPQAEVAPVQTPLAIYQEDTKEKCPCASGNVKPRTDSIIPRSPRSGSKSRISAFARLYEYLHNKLSYSNQIVIEKCPCSHHPHHKDVIERACSCMAGHAKPHRIEDVLDKCPCSGKPKPHHKEPISGAELFVASTHAIMNCVEGGIIANNTGNLKDGLPLVIEGLTVLANLASRSENPEQTYQEVCKFMAGFNEQEMGRLLQTAKTHAVA